MYKAKHILLLLLTALTLASCGTTNTVPITGRKQHLLVSDAQVLSLSNQQYQQYMKTAKPSTDVAATAMVKRVGERLAQAVVTYLNQHNLGAEVSQYKWEFNLVQDKEANRVVLEMILHEGKNREIRKMCAAVGLEVARLRRTQIGGVKMGMLKQGDWRDLTEKEVKNLLANPIVNGRVI